MEKAYCLNSRKKESSCYSYGKRFAFRLNRVLLPKYQVRKLILSNVHHFEIQGKLKAAKHQEKDIFNFALGFEISSNVEGVYKTKTY